MRGTSSTLLLLCLLAGAGCQGFRPRPFEKASVQSRIETRERDGLQVSATVLSRAEAKQVFGVDLYAWQIQPVWLRLRNRTEEPYWLMLKGLDASYFSPREAATKSHYAFRPATNHRMDEHFDRLGIIAALPPRGETWGFAFTPVKVGTKEVRVRLLTQGDVEDFDFRIPVPGFRADYHAVDWESLRSSAATVDPETLEFFDGYPSPKTVTAVQDTSTSSAAYALSWTPCPSPRSAPCGKGCERGGPRTARSGSSRT